MRVRVFGTSFATTNKTLNSAAFTGTNTALGGSPRFARRVGPASAQQICRLFRPSGENHELGDHPVGRFDLDIGGRPAGVAVQRQLGLLAQRRPGTGSAGRARAAFDGKVVTAASHLLSLRWSP